VDANEMRGGETRMWVRGRQARERDQDGRRGRSTQGQKSSPTRSRGRGGEQRSVSVSWLVGEPRRAEELRSAVPSREGAVGRESSVGGRPSWLERTKGDARFRIC
jgi:hypothetical protein